MGYRIELGEIETALYSVKGLREAVCFYDAMRDRIVCVYAGDLDTNTLAKALRTALPKYMLPNVYEKLEALPHNANGKLDRAALKERFCMRRVESYAALTPLLSAQLRRGVVTNCFYPRQTISARSTPGFFTRKGMAFCCCCGSGPGTGS